MIYLSACSVQLIGQFFSFFLFFLFFLFFSFFFLFSSFFFFFFFFSFSFFFFPSFLFIFLFFSFFSFFAFFPFFLFPFLLFYFLFIFPFSLSLFPVFSLLPFLLHAKSSLKACLGFLQTDIQCNTDGRGICSMVETKPGFWLWLDDNISRRKGAYQYKLQARVISPHQSIVTRIPSHIINPVPLHSIPSPVQLSPVQSSPARSNLELQFP